MRIHETYQRKKVPFEPHDETHVRFYVCGPTVYDYAHIGNARPVVVFDVLYRLLRRLYSKVTYVRNITDIDDKINARAAETGEPIGEITRRTAEQFHADMAALGALEPDEEPRATEHVGLMVEMIEDLVAKDHAYEAEGHVLFNVPSMETYGRLSRHSRDELVAGARVEVAPYKRDPADFVLWKPSDADLPGWESPWGRGRPGWHIECSAMSSKYLGLDFDIHGGGQDLIFPHHENEIAQSLCAHPEAGFAKYWMHNGYLQAEGEKMSKSLGNFYTVNELLSEFPGEAIRLLLLKTHYRQPLDFTRSGLEEAKRDLDRFYGALRNAGAAAAPAGEPRSMNAGEPAGPDTGQLPDDDPLILALADDLNTPLAFHELTNRVHIMNTILSRSGEGPGRAEELAAVRTDILAYGQLLGLLGQDPEDWFKWRPAAGDTLDEADIEAMIEARKTAREAKDFAEADRIRDDLAVKGVLLEDKPEGTIWRRG